MNDDFDYPVESTAFWMPAKVTPTTHKMGGSIGESPVFKDAPSPTFTYESEPRRRQGESPCTVQGLPFTLKP